MDERYYLEEPHRESGKWPKPGTRSRSCRRKTFPLPCRSQCVLFDHDAERRHPKPKVVRTHIWIMKNILGLLVSTTFVLSVHQVRGTEFRPPAVPLVTHDPYFSIWSMTDHLTDQPTKHWTGAVQSLSSLVHVDGKTYRMMGTEPKGVPILPQTHLDVLPTHTAYQFEGGGIHV
jgi:Domain of unknown function (DUF4964)